MREYLYINTELSVKEAFQMGALCTSRTHLEIEYTHTHTERENADTLSTLLHGPGQGKAHEAGCLVYGFSISSRPGWAVELNKPLYPGISGKTGLSLTHRNTRMRKHTNMQAHNL